MKYFGEQGTGASVANLGNRIVYQGAYTCPQRGIAIQLVAYMDVSGLADGLAKGAIYYSAGTKFVPWAVTEERTIRSVLGARQYYFQFPSPPILRSDMSYSLALWGNLNGIDQPRVYTSATLKNWQQQVITYAPTWPDPGIPGLGGISSPIISCEYLESNLLESLKVRTPGIDLDPF